jgi:hypothetical protein
VPALESFEHLSAVFVPGMQRVSTDLDAISAAIDDFVAAVGRTAAALSRECRNGRASLSAADAAVAGFRVDVSAREGLEADLRRRAAAAKSRLAAPVRSPTLFSDLRNAGRLSEAKSAQGVIGTNFEGIERAMRAVKRLEGSGRLRGKSDKVAEIGAKICQAFREAAIGAVRDELVRKVPPTAVLEAAGAGLRRAKREKVADRAEIARHVDALDSNIDLTVSERIRSDRTSKEAGNRRALEEEREVLRREIAALEQQRDAKRAVIERLQAAVRLLAPDIGRS